MRNCEPIVGKAGEPSAPVKAGQFLHQVDFVNPAGVTDLFNRPAEDSLSAVLPQFGAQKDAYRWLGTRGYTVSHSKDDALRLGTCTQRMAIPQWRQEPCNRTSFFEESHSVATGLQKLS